MKSQGISTMSIRILAAGYLALLLASVAQAAGPRTLRVLEEAAESSLLDISLSTDSDGRVLARLCDSCELLTLSVNESTQVFLGGAPATLRMAVENRARGATVIFDPESRVVKRILLWN